MDVKHSALGRSLVLLCLFTILFVAVPLSRAQSEQRINPKPRPGSPPFENTVYAPIVKLMGYPSATLVFNNRSPKEQVAFVTFFDQQGNATPEQQLVLPGGAVTYRTVDDLLPLYLSHRHELGGVSVRYIGHWNEVATQLILVSDLRTGSFEYRLLPATVFRSRQQNAVWWMPSDAETGIAVGNSGLSPATVSVTLPDGKQNPIRLQDMRRA